MNKAAFNPALLAGLSGLAGQRLQQPTPAAPMTRGPKLTAKPQLPPKPAPAAQTAAPAAKPAPAPAPAPMQQPAAPKSASAAFAAGVDLFFKEQGIDKSAVERIFGVKQGGLADALLASISAE